MPDELQQGRGLPDADRATEGDSEPDHYRITGSLAFPDSNSVTVSNADGFPYIFTDCLPDTYTDGDIHIYSDSAPDGDSWWRRVLRGLDPTAPR